MLFLTIFVLKSISVAGVVPDGQVWAISGHFRPLHGPRWSKLSFKHPFYTGNQCCLICPKIDIWGCSWSRWPRLGHFWPFVAPYMVYDGPNWAPSINFVLWINVALSIFVLKSISEAEGAPDGQVLAISSHVHGRRWSRLTFKHPFHIENQCCLKQNCPKIDVWGWRGSLWASFGHSQPPHGPRRS